MPPGAGHEQNKIANPTNPAGTNSSGRMGKPAPTRGSLTLGFLAVLAVLGLSGYLGMGWFLSSRQAADRFEARLSESLGVPVRVEGATIGWTDGTQLTGLEVSEAGETHQGRTWLTVPRARLDLAALDFLRGGKGPSEVELEGAVIQLRFDADGKLLTRLPRPRGGADVPRLHLTGSRITLLQEGREPLALSGLQGDIESRAGALILTATVDDPEQGKWDVRGSLNTTTHEAELHLLTDRTVVDRDRLEKLPFVSPNVWRHVRIDSGTTSVDLTLNFHLDDPGVHYHLQLGPEQTRLHVSSIQLDAEKVSGRVRVEDGQVTLDKVQGQTASGRISTSGDLNFRDPNYRMKFQMEVQRVQLRELPRAWNLPAGVSGRLTGKAQLLVTVEEGQVWTVGDGAGAIDWPRPFGMSLLPNIPLRMHADGQKFHFAVQLPIPSKLPVECVSPKR